MTKRRIHTIFNLVAGALALCGCTNHEGEFFEAVKHDHSAILFGVYSASPSTRAGDSYITTTSFSEGDAIGVMGFYHDKSTWDSDKGTLEPNFMYDQAVIKKENGSWEYSPLKYWPNETDGGETEKDVDGNGATSKGGPDRLSFYGYYPYRTSDNGITLPTNETPGMGTWNFEVKANAAEQVDFMMSQLVPDMTKPKIGETIELKFSHLLSRVTVAATLSDELVKDGCTLEIQQVIFGQIYTDGELTPEYDNDKKTTTFKWNNIQSPERLYCNWSNEKGKENNNVFLMLPQTLQADATLAIKYTITFPADKDNKYGYKYTDMSGSVLLSKGKDQSGNTVESWVMNKAYQYNVEINLDEILFDAEVYDWINDGYGIKELDTKKEKI